ncbi:MULTISPECIES: LysR family transcriptional regulator [unclassified Acidovorax]|uniref:LysR family transcriptional regulator n=1 Tax=unclassified Acidovorax TaxID=2684926 RepID=UPI000C1832A0|nr:MULTISPECIES: LysR family transcriptional regulator [unclassified Acidovorax]PIF16732.1 DNA-binding transcriptional LysR family regulator [Acidovorax sp. 59]PKW04244.1 DNA-binding transcriptional LysR family regulator [Acidovorax sp. 30]
MLDGVSLDQLRTFVAAADEGSFSAAARKLNRVQSAVSGWVSSLEAQIGVTLFDRTGRFPKLTPEGVLLLADARNIVSNVDVLKARAKLISGGLEAELSVVFDVFYPTAAIAAAAKAFAQQFPLTPLRLFVEGLGAGYEPVLDGRCSLGILGALPLSFPSLVSERLQQTPLVMVAAPDHPLSRIKRRIARRELAKHVQLVLTDRSELMVGRDYGVSSPSTWRLADLSTKYAFLKGGVGWGSMPMHMVDQDIMAGTLIVLDTDDMPKSGFMLSMSAFYPAASPPGPAGRWLIQLLKGGADASSEDQI